MQLRKQHRASALHHRKAPALSVRMLAGFLVIALLLPSFSNQAFAACGGGGGCGGKEEEGGGSGQGSGQALMALAAIIGPIAAAAAQIASANAQASADKFIATTAATAAITQTQIQASTTKQLADNQRQMSEQNLAATREIAGQQEANATTRLETQLAALQSEREAQSVERAEIRGIEQKRLDDQLALVREQVDQQLKLAKMQINSQVLAQALAGGGGTVPSFGGSGIGITQTGITATSGTSGLPTGLGSSLTGARTATGSVGVMPSQQVVNANQNAGARGMTASIPASVRASQNAAAASGSRASVARGLASVPSSAGQTFSMANNFGQNLAARATNTKVAGLGVNVPASLSNKMRGIAGRLGSTRKQFNQISEENKGSDLSNLIDKVRRGTNETKFTEFHSQEAAPQREVTVVESRRELSGAYNAPSSVGATPSRGHGHRARSIGF